MATSGSFSGNAVSISGRGGQYIFTNWQMASQEIGNNRSSINWQTYMHFDNADSQLDAGLTTSNVGDLWRNDGRVKNYEGKITTRDHGLASGSFWIGHNSDGTQSLSLSSGITPYRSSRTAGSGSWGLTQIPRNATISTATDFNDEGNPTITWSNPAGNNLTTFQAGIYMTNASTALAAYRDISKTGSSYTFQLTAAERNAMRAATPNSNTLKVRFYLKSIIGGVTSIPYLERNLTIVNGKPTFTSFSYLDTNASTTAITGNNQLLIQGKSTLQATIPSANKATPNKSATMSQYLFSIASFNGSQPYSSSSNVVQNIGAISQSGTQRLNVTALDSRSNTTVAYKDITVIPYTQPLINASATRAGGGFETQTTIHIEGVMSLIQVSGSTKNAVNATNGVKYRYKQSSSSSWGTWTPLTSTTNASGKITTADILINFDNNSQWDIEVSITDKLSTTVQPITLSSGIPILFVDRQKKVGVNKRPQNGDLDVAGKIYSGGQPLMPSHVGQVIFSTTLNTAAKVAAIYGGSWVAFAVGRTVVGIDTSQTEFNTVKKTGGSKTVTLSTNQMPSHSHGVPTWANNSGSTLFAQTQQNISTPWFGMLTSSTGGSQAHDNMPPYAVAYAWERVS